MLKPQQIIIIMSIGLKQGISITAENYSFIKDNAEFEMALRYLVSAEYVREVKMNNTPYYQLDHKGLVVYGICNDLVNF